MVIVDDEEMVITSVRAFLSLETEYDIHGFTDPEEAARFLETQSRRRGRQRLPDAENERHSTARQGEAAAAGSRRVLLTGHADKQSAIQAINEVGLFQYLEKPWDNSQLLLVIQSAIERTQLFRSLREKITELDAAHSSLKDVQSRLLRAFSMSEAPFNEPRLALNRIYTKRGDTGETSLVGGQRAPKDALRIECYGTVDELNSFTGMACFAAEREPALAPLPRSCKRVQHELFNLGSILATLPEDVHPKQPQVTPVEIAQLEREIDEMNAAFPSLRSFVLPGGTEINAILHVCRTVCRRAERLCVTLAREDPLRRMLFNT